MPASRIVFAIGDLMAQLTQLQPPGRDIVDATVHLVLDDKTFDAAEREIANHYSGMLVKDRRYEGREHTIRLGNMTLVRLPPRGGR